MTTTADGQLTFDDLRADVVTLKTYARPGDPNFISTRKSYPLTAEDNTLEIVVTEGALIQGDLKLASGEPAKKINLKFIDDADSLYGGGPETPAGVGEDSTGILSPVGCAVRTAYLHPFDPPACIHGYFLIHPFPWPVSCPRLRICPCFSLFQTVIIILKNLALFMHFT